MAKSRSVWQFLRKLDLFLKIKINNTLGLALSRPTKERPELS